MIARLQQTVGNRAVTAMLAREPLEYVAEPHEGGDAAGLLAALGPADAAADVADAAPPAAPDPIGDWTGRSLATNAEYAQWIVDGAGLGFVVWSPGMGAQKQMEDLAAGKTVKGTDPSKPAVISGLKTIKALVDGRVAKWRADEAKPKDPVSVGSFIRGPGGHDGRSIDVNGFDWTGANGPVQVEEALRALPAGSYGIGLPFQGQFFPKSEWLKERKAAAGDQDVTEPSLEKFVGTRYTSKNLGEGKWEDKKASGQAIDRLKSTTLKTAIADLNGKGYKIYVFPDNDNHIHIQSP
jgi:hypothetical protein